MREVTGYGGDRLTRLRSTPVTSTSAFEDLLIERAELWARLDELDATRHALRCSTPAAAPTDMTTTDLTGLAITDVQRLHTELRGELRSAQAALAAARSSERTGRWRSRRARRTILTVGAALVPLGAVASAMVNR